MKVHAGSTWICQIRFIYSKTHLQLDSMPFFPEYHVLGHFTWAYAEIKILRSDLLSLSKFYMDKGHLKETQPLQRDIFKESSSVSYKHLREAGH